MAQRLQLELARHCETCNGKFAVGWTQSRANFDAPALEREYSTDRCRERHAVVMADQPLW